MLNLLSLALLQDRNVERAAAGLAGLGCVAILFVVFLSLAVSAFVIYCWWRILTKAGFAGPLALLNLVPGIGTLILIIMLAFSDWPQRRG